MLTQITLAKRARPIHWTVGLASMRPAAAVTDTLHLETAMRDRGLRSQEPLASYLNTRNGALE
jgi:hypothetical protein